MATLEIFQDVMNCLDALINGIAFERPKMADMIYANQPRHRK